MTVYELQGVRPTLAVDVFVAPNATVIGDVVIGASSSIWFGTVVRGDVYPIRIGARTNVQDNTVIHVTTGLSSTTIGDDVTIGHGAIVHGCTIGNRCLVGMGSIILDDAVIGDDCFVAAGSLVTPRTNIPPGSMVRGRPAKVVGLLDEAQRMLILGSAQHYVENAHAFATLTPLP